VVVFGIGVVVATLRLILVIPVIGEMPAVVIESPTMLTVSWIVCRRCVDRLRVAREPLTGLQWERSRSSC
jgi:hypothetical protein